MIKVTGPALATQSLARTFLPEAIASTRSLPRMCCELIADSSFDLGIVGGRVQIFTRSRRTLDLVDGGSALLAAAEEAQKGLASQDSMLKGRGPVSRWDS